MVVCARPGSCDAHCCRPRRVRRTPSCRQRQLVLNHPPSTSTTSRHTGTGPFQKETPSATASVQCIARDADSLLTRCDEKLEKSRKVKSWFTTKETLHDIIASCWFLSGEAAGSMSLQRVRFAATTSRCVRSVLVVATSNFHDNVSRSSLPASYRQCCIHSMGSVRRARFGRGLWREAMEQGDSVRPFAVPATESVNQKVLADMGGSSHSFSVEAMHCRKEDSGWCSGWCFAERFLRRNCKDANLDERIKHGRSMEYDGSRFLARRES